MSNELKAWKFCPECGCRETINDNQVSENSRQCKECEQEWWTDINYWNSRPTEPKEQIAEADTMLRVAEGQLLGYYLSSCGTSITELVESMGLEKGEWAELSGRVNLKDADREEIEEYFLAICDEVELEPHCNCTKPHEDPTARGICEQCGGNIICDEATK